MTNALMSFSSWATQVRNRVTGFDHYPDPWSYFGPGGLAEMERVCAEANRDLPAFVRPPEKIAAVQLRRDGSRVGRRGVRVDDWSFDTPLPSGDPDNDRVRLRVYSPPVAGKPDRAILFHHPVYQRSWRPWEWFLGDLIRRMPVAFLVGPWHLARAGAGRFAGEGTLNPNPARMFEALRQWCWDHQAAVDALRRSEGLRVAAEIGYSMGGFQLLLLASAGRVDVPIVTMASTNHYAWGLTRGVMARGVVQGMREVGIDEARLFELTSSVHLERHVGILHGKPVMSVYGTRDWVDPPPSLDRLRDALQPARCLRLGAGHATLVLHRRRIFREVLDFLEQQGALPRQAPMKWGLRRFSRT